MATQAVPFKPRFGAFILETLTLGMYGESRNALREYVQNSFDSLQQAVADGLVDRAAARVDVILDQDHKWLSIRDNGIGLRTENAVSVLASVGDSNKNFRRDAGFRGIGRLAGIVFCDRLTFTTKAKGQVQQTVVIFRADELRKKLEPSAIRIGDAAETLASCVEARVEPAADAEEHFFQVELSGFSNPPEECEDFAKLKSFLSQVSPLPYQDEFPFKAEILARGVIENAPIESIHLFVQHGAGKPEELFKPYGADFAVKRERTALASVEYLSSPGKWWGWIGRAKKSGQLKDTDSRGIRVRVRNIQIDGTAIMRDIFNYSRKEGKPRSSYARFVDWYVGEIFIHPEAAIPNARRDGFEEDEKWEDIRDELDEQVADRFGKMAYRTSKADTLSLDSLTKRLVILKEGSEPLIESGQASWDAVSYQVAEANELQKRVTSAVSAADDTELVRLRELSETVTSLRNGLDRLVLETPAPSGCEAEVADALSDFTQQLYRTLRDRLGPGEWQTVYATIRELSGEDMI